jgi:hypothetical protein
MDDRFLLILSETGMKTKLSYRAAGVLLTTILLDAGTSAAAPRVLDGASHHLGTPGKPEWEEFAASPAEGRTLTVRFAAEDHRGEATLFIRQRGVKLAWRVRLNSRDLGALAAMEEPLVLALAVPPGVVRAGENVLAIAGSAGDDIVVDEVALDLRPVGAVLAEAGLAVRVRDADSGAALPCRITVADERGALAALSATPDLRCAIRPGVAYTADGQARLGVRAGRYTVYATRGFEYGMAQAGVDVEPGQVANVSLTIRREVATPGLIACDTHVHTLTHSGHGDATIEERVVTLAGEGIELPIATDHNHLTDLGPTAQRAGVAATFTPVIGDEVTTQRGHFNAFAFAVGETAPDFQSSDWPELIRGIRAGSSDRMVILNHPRDLHGKFRPFDPEHFNATIGALRGGGAFTFDAVEVINSGAMQSDLLRVFRDWFALWNHGTPVTAVGSSDSHDVSRSIVGQGRTYVACPDADPGRIDIDAACRSLRAGRALVSFGLLADLVVDERFHPGDLATGLGATLRVTVQVVGPSWTRADQVSLYANGVLLRESTIEPSAVAGEKARITWQLDRPPQDLALVAVAAGPGVTAPYWPTPRPYQPTSPVWRPRVLAATNPVRVDGDGDGVFTSPRAQAETVVSRQGTAPERLIPALAAYDEATATQAADLCQAAGRDLRGASFARHLSEAPEPVRRGFAALAK